MLIRPADYELNIPEGLGKKLEHQRLVKYLKKLENGKCMVLMEHWMKVDEQVAEVL
jgi:hypothetical protein